MWTKSERRIIWAINIAGLILFLIIAPITIIWALGWQFNRSTHSFQSTAEIALTGDLSNATISLNGQVEGSSTPLSIENLANGNYLLTITRDGYYPFQDFVSLTTGQVVKIEQDALIAEDPQVSTNSGVTYNQSDPFDVGLSWSSGELTDYGTLVTRLSSNDIIQAHRFNNGYLYQEGADIHLFFPGQDNDYIIYRSTSSQLLEMNLDPGNWQLTVFEVGNSPKLIQLTKNNI